MSKYQFLKVPISDEGVWTSLHNELLQLMPKSVQILNILRLIKKQLYDIEHLDFEIWSCEEVRNFSGQDKDMNIIEWRRKCWNVPNVPFFLLCIIKCKQERQKDYIYTLNFLFSKDVPIVAVEDAFVNLPEETINWTKEPVEFGAVNEELLPFMRSVISRKGNFQVKENPVWFMYCKQNLDELIASQISDQSSDNEKYTIGKLRAEDAELVSSFWKYGSEEATFIIRDSIKYFISAGLTCEGRLVSWVISLPGGTLNALHTLKEFRRLGYGAAVIKYAMKEAIKLNIFPIVEIEADNLISKNLMDGLGFQTAYVALWLACSRASLENTKEKNT